MPTQWKMTSMIINRNDDELEIEVDGNVHYTKEKFWGSDADGNKGMFKYIIEDMTDIGGITIEGEPIELTEQEKEEAAEKLGDAFMEG